MQMKRWASCLGRLNPGERALMYPVTIRLGESPNWSGHLGTRKISDGYHDLNFRMSSLWPSHYTNYAIPAPQSLSSFINPFAPVDHSTCRSMGFKMPKLAKSSPLTCTVQTHPTYSFKLRNFKKVKNFNNSIFRMCAMRQTWQKNTAWW